MTAEEADGAERQAADEDGAAEDGELELGDEQERGHEQDVDEVCYGVWRLEKHRVDDTLGLGGEGGQELGLDEELVEL